MPVSSAHTAALAARNIHPEEPETFSTPPTTPAAWAGLNGHAHGHHDPLIRPSLSRRSSRPSSLTIERSQPEYKLNIELETTSPPPPDRNATSLNGHLAVKPIMAAQDPNGHLKKTPTALTNPAVQSPCFVHSHLDKNFALGAWKLKQDQQGDLGVAKSLQYPAPPDSTESYASSLASTLEDDEDEYTSSLTTRLAETAVGVREMSKQLGAYFGK